MTDAAGALCSIWLASLPLNDYTTWHKTAPAWLECQEARDIVKRQNATMNEVAGSVETMVVRPKDWQSGSPVTSQIAPVMSPVRLCPEPLYEVIPPASATNAPAYVCIGRKPYD